MKHILPIFLLASLLLPTSVAAFTTISPESGAINVKVNSFFQWEAVPGAAKYILDIAKFTQSEDNIPGTICGDEGTCVFQFFSLSVGRIQVADSYTWKVTAYTQEGTPAGTSNVATFSTEQAPEVVTPDPGNGGGNGGGGPIIDPSNLNPISSTNLNELFTSVRNFLFGLSIVLLPIVILYGGFLMLTARGDPEKISRARTILLWAVIAFAIILLAGGLPRVIADLL